MTVSRRTLAVGGAAAATLLVLLANAHLVYVSVQSQPDCVTHLKPGTHGDGDAYSAAGSAC
jgi:hypothetical protein